MLASLKLLVPALIPSWNFFDWIAPSPRVDFGLSDAAEALPTVWKGFRPAPPVIPAGALATRLLWNARRNEALFVTACAERLLDNPTAHSEEEILARIVANLPTRDDDRHIRFRLTLVQRADSSEALNRKVAYLSAPRLIGACRRS